MTNKYKTQIQNESILIVCLVAFFLIVSLTIVIATPTGPSSINVTSNETAATTVGMLVNISGGYVAKLNITASVQNEKWKAFAGWINGEFSLDDASGSTIYDWTMGAVTGEVYATRASAQVEWTTIMCANQTQIDAEDTILEHTGTDNISSTFNASSNAETFTVAGFTVSPTDCYAINTYVNDIPQTTDFEEVILYDTTNNYTIFTAVLEDGGATGYDGANYDFQMIVPENGSISWQGTTPYYLYVEVQ